jgi:hypothetical protein
MIALHYFSANIAIPVDFLAALGAFRENHSSRNTADQA